MTTETREPGTATDHRGRRDTSRDGLRNRLEAYALGHGEPIWRALQGHPSVRRAANRALINSGVRKMPARPNPLSTMSAYTSWASLIDRTYSSRHLPPVPDQESGRPGVDEVAKLFAREGRTKLCPRSTVLFPAFAQWFTDGFLRGETRDGRDPRRTLSPHEIDLCQLYGLDDEVTACLRTFSGGRLKSRLINGAEFPPALCEHGAVKPEFSALSVAHFDQVPADRRDDLFAAGSDRANSNLGPMMMNVLFLREHNRIAGELAEGHPRWDDERIFQTTRNILIVMLIRIVLEEYINHITPYHFRFVLDHRIAATARWNRQNWASVEFNLLYRWHGLVPSTVLVGGRPVPLAETLHNGRMLVERGLGPAMADASAQPAGRIGLFNTDPVLLPVETASLAEGRAVQLASYNDYRAYCGFPRVTDVGQISGDPQVQEGLRATYRSVADIELYTGLFAEEPREGGVLGRLLGRIVTVDALSQALTNPLLAPRIFTPETFSPIGMRILRGTRCLSDVLHRNIPEDPGRYDIAMGRGGKHAPRAGRSS
ncbi:peroxidase family protein [Actinomadura scrupuli]|uniref:peroxidase family protein n=1 Tax=Actinomadura scrupuli TaxID=559629 RepID=UPI003D9640BF